MFRHFISLMLLSFSLPSFAVGLGQYRLLSSHNQPLNAEIQLLSATGYNENEFQVKLASNEEYEKRGIDKSFSLNEIIFKTSKNKNGEIVIKLSTNQSIKEPHLNFLIELNCAKGKLVKEYTFLFDANALNQ